MFEHILVIFIFFCVYLSNHSTHKRIRVVCCIIKINHRFTIRWKIHQRYVSLCLQSILCYIFYVCVSVRFNFNSLPLHSFCDDNKPFLCLSHFKKKTKTFAYTFQSHFSINRLFIFVDFNAIF